MTRYNFDEVTSRQNTGCLKYDFAVQRGRPADVLPFWVADMDFPIAREIQEALLERCQHAIFGYSESDDAYFAAVHDWYAKHFGWETQQEWLTKTPGVVFALAAAVRAFTKPGEGVLINQPVYYPFSEVIKDNKRELINSPLVLKDGKYSIDFADLEKKIIEHRVKLYILCSPHNPVGRVWTSEELRRMLDICKAHDVKVIADEIHNDFVFEPYTHHCAATVGSYDDILVTLMAPSKTFNLAGCQNAFVIIPDEGLRQQFDALQKTLAMTNGSMFGYIAAEAAYRGGAAWFDELKQTVWENYTFARDALTGQLPQAVVSELQGTYLMWIDLGAYLAPAELEDFFQHRCRLAVDYGRWFGKSGQTMVRLNLATSRENVQTAVTAIARELKSMGRS